MRDTTVLTSLYGIIQAVDYMNYIPKVLEQMSSIWMCLEVVSTHTLDAFFSVFV